jgi:hypothetical protein
MVAARHTYEVLVVSPRQTAGTARFLVSSLFRLPMLLFDPSLPVLPPSTLAIRNRQTHRIEAVYSYASTVEDAGSMRLHETELQRDLSRLSAGKFRRTHLFGARDPR